MRIQSIQQQPIAEVPFLNAGRRAGDFYRDTLPVHLGYVDRLPAGLSTIIVAADLQGRETFQSADGQPLRLLGEVLPNFLSQEVIPSLGIGSDRIGVILAGDFYTVPALDKRGGTGDVTTVWQAFADQFNWVVGVAGNHDLFGDKATRPRFSKPKYFLDEDCIEVDQLSIAGLSGIVGNPKRPWRRMVDDYNEALQQLLCENPDIIILHDGPNGPESSQKGMSEVRDSLEAFDPTLVIRGHAHWDEPLAELANGTQVLNVDARAVVLTRCPKN